MMLKGKSQKIEPIIKDNFRFKAIFLQCRMENVIASDDSVNGAIFLQCRMENVIASDDSVNGSEILQLYRANPWSTAENHNIYYIYWLV